MQTDKHLQKRQTKNFEAADTINCFEIKAKLDELSSGKISLEKMDRMIKTFLLRHLETCTGCCRAFDVRMQFRPSRSATIY